MKSWFRKLIRFLEYKGKILIEISDNASNITNAIKEKLKLIRYGCSSHEINLIATAVLDKNKEIVDLIQNY